MNDMYDMRANERAYNERGNERAYNERAYGNREYDDRAYNNRPYDEREYDEREYDNRRSYDRRGGRRNNRAYRSYREQDYYEELEMLVQDMKEQYRKFEDIYDMVKNPQEKNMIMRVAQKEKENYTALKQMMEQAM